MSLVEHDLHQSAPFVSLGAIARCQPLILFLARRWLLLSFLVVVVVATTTTAAAAVKLVFKTLSRPLAPRRFKTKQASRP